MVPWGKVGDVKGIWGGGRVRVGGWEGGDSGAEGWEGYWTPSDFVVLAHLSLANQKKTLKAKTVQYK